MCFRLFLKSFCVWRLRFWIGTVAVLWIASDPVLAQEGVAWPAPTIAARSAVLMNPTTGEILFAKEPRLRLPPASTTKVLTALVALERLHPLARAPVSPQAASAPPSRVGLRAGEAALVQDLLYGLMLKSGNDAAETLAEAAGGSIAGFAELMNLRAWQIGARDSHFMNPHGLPNDDHYTTAYDLALIFRQAMSHPVFADIVRTRSAALRIESGRGLYSDWRMVPVRNTNRLLATYEGARGGKTGFTFKARRCFVGEVDRGGVRLIVAILNSPNSGALWQDARTLLDYGFARYGLAPPPPVQPEPTPVMMVRRAPATPVVARTAVTRALTASKGKGVRTVSIKLASRQTSKTAKANASSKPASIAVKKTSVDKSGSKTARIGKLASTATVKANNKQPLAKAGVARAEKTLVAKPRKTIKKQGG
ncbi:MAG: D-alanyl-D-alanine carboxypeptidase [Candidatus Competibacteraceae bacterium]|nr:D-alanyl-D-alanine carboxypeptidase [Candidatus Competibacteraceae bacterium]